ncbi:hypothetical protein QUB28_01970 [Microcoleus sp. B4-C3]|uniref:hypothetical protein n=1 Tax=Microcoleus sp. B4-C2 TaxID=2818661 RepID=UPI002FD57673
MPVPQKMNFIVEQASCLFIKRLLRMVQYLSCSAFLVYPGVQDSSGRCITMKA